MELFWSFVILFVYVHVHLDHLVCFVTHLILILQVIFESFPFYFIYSFCSRLKIRDDAKMFFF